MPANVGADWEVRMRESDIAQDGDGRVDGEATDADEMRTERLALDERHGVVREPVALSGGEERHHVRVLEPRSEAEERLLEPFAGRFAHDGTQARGGVAGAGYDEWRNEHTAIRGRSNHAQLKERGKATSRLMRNRGSLSAPTSVSVLSRSTAGPTNSWFRAHGAHANSD